MLTPELIRIVDRFFMPFRRRGLSNMKSITKNSKSAPKMYGARLSQVNTVGA
jgi:hypothetical protein